MTEARRSMDKALANRVRGDGDKVRRTRQAQRIRETINPQFDEHLSAREAQRRGVG